MLQRRNRCGSKLILAEEAKENGLKRNSSHGSIESKIDENEYLSLFSDTKPKKNKENSGLQYRRSISNSHVSIRDKLGANTRRRSSVKQLTNAMVQKFRGKSSIKKEKKEGHLEKEKPRLESLFSDDFIETCLFDISHTENNAPRPPTQYSPKPLTTLRFQKFEKPKNLEKFGSPLRQKTTKTPLRNISILSNKTSARRPTCLR